MFGLLLALHIIPVTVISVLFVLVGVSFELVGWYDSDRLK